MHKSRNFFLAALFALAAPAGLLAAWDWQNPLPQGNSLRDVAFLSATEGFAVGERGTILHTTDGGGHWRILNMPTTESFWRLAAVDVEHIWAVGTRGTILFGGVTTPWVSQPSGTGRDLRGVHFVDILHGYAVGDTGTILKTTDGGQTWNGNDSEPLIDDLLGVHFVDADTGWAVGGYSRTHPAVIVKTTDGGQTWQRQDAPSGWLADVTFTDATHGYAVGRGGSGEGLLLRTTNGRTWSEVGQSADNSNAYRAVTFRDPGCGYAVSQDGRIAATADSGATWTAYMLETGCRLDGVAVVGNAIWAVGAYGAIFHAALPDDWQRQDRGSRASLCSIAFATPDTGYALAVDDSLLRTTDGGISWQAESEADTASRALYFHDAEHGWKVGADGLIARSADAGASWTVVHSGGGILHAVLFANPRCGWTVGDNGTILRTTDGGDSWTAQFTGEQTFLAALAVIDSSHAFLAGGGGRIYRTTDAGQNWSRQTSNTDEALRAIVFSDADHGCAAGDNGVIVRTTDGGDTWAPASSGATASLTALIHFAGDTLMAVGYSGTILHSWDGGANWEQEVSRVRSNLTGLARAADNALWICGEYGTILHRAGYHISPVSDPLSLHPSAFRLAAYPNPFNPTTTIEWILPAPDRITLRVYDLAGRLVTTLADRPCSAGEHALALDASAWPSGIYFARLEASAFTHTQKLVLLK